MDRMPRTIGAKRGETPLVNLYCIFAICSHRAGVSGFYFDVVAFVSVCICIRCCCEEISRGQIYPEKQELIGIMELYGTQIPNIFYRNLLDEASIARLILTPS